MQLLSRPHLLRSECHVNPRSGWFSVWAWFFLVGVLSQAAGKSWKLEAETDIAGYEVSYGRVSGKYTTTIDVGRRFETVISGIREGETCYAVVRPYNKKGVRGRFSAEMKYSRRPDRLNKAPDAVITAPSTGGTIVAGQSVDFSGTGEDPGGKGSLSYRWNFGEGSGIADSISSNPAAVRFNVPGTYLVSLIVTDSEGLADPTPATRSITVLPSWSEIPRTGWSLKYVNSEEADGFAATRSFDGDPQTFWHTQWRAANLPPPPHQIQINLGGSRLVKGFEYLPRQDGYPVGTIGRFEFYVSTDGSDWGKPVATGEFTASSTEKRVFSTPKTGKFIRLVSLTEANGATDCAVAELNILEGPPPNRKPTASGRSVKTTKGKTVRITLKGADADRNPLTYEIVRGPRHGTLSGTLPNLIYKPGKKFTGSDRVTYRIHDGTSYSRTASIKIKVKKSGGSSGKKKSGLMLAGRPDSGSTAGNASMVPHATVFPAQSKTGPILGSEIIDGLKYLTLTAPKPAAADGLKLRIEVSPDLVDWFSGKSHTTILTDNEKFLKVRDNTPILPGRKRYIRLRTTRP